jgi:RNA polymerase sigma factor (sigma-70 family)
MAAVAAPLILRNERMAEQPTLPSNPRVAVTELEALHHAAYSWALTRCGRRRAEAADVLQAAYARILDGSAQFDGRSALKTFLFGVVDRIAREERRRERIRAALRGQFSAAFVPSEIDQPSNITPNSDTDRVRIALLALSARQRDVLELVFYRDCTIEEAAAIIGIKVGTARTHYERGKRAMTDALAGRTLGSETSND